ncbi:hypothetical protein CHU95_11530 [Niveispirillum lacus]|uniref:Uncharacterized protein n=1 Tax=Niveispirillum lacus TaxID=1981099 RepID=A0A255YXY3_9PROT|nr:sensor histidine kinase [Niveispirillum lacus]OYQ34096.1 hypothetical protein CHU95_11530 [Niveispirillum lacus]
MTEQAATLARSDGQKVPVLFSITPLDDGPAIDLRPKAALALAMVFQELATNAAKYGAFCQGGPSGRTLEPGGRGRPRAST